MPYLAGQTKARLLTCSHLRALSARPSPQIERDLFPGDAPDLNVEYEVVVITSNIPGAGTDANVFVQMFGTEGKWRRPCAAAPVLVCACVGVGAVRPFCWGKDYGELTVSHGILVIPHAHTAIPKPLARLHVCAPVRRRGGPAAAGQPQEQLRGGRHGRVQHQGAGRGRPQEAAPLPRQQGPGRGLALRDRHREWACAFASVGCRHGPIHCLELHCPPRAAYPPTQFCHFQPCVHTRLSSHTQTRHTPGPRRRSPTRSGGARGTSTAASGWTSARAWRRSCLPATPTRAPTWSPTASRCTPATSRARARTPTCAWRCLAPRAAAACASSRAKATCLSRCGGSAGLWGWPRALVG